MKPMNRFWVGCLVVSLAYSATPSFSAPMVSGMKWMPYQNSALHFTLKLPAVWQVKEKENVVGITTPDEDPSRAAMGILKSSKKMTIQEAASKHLGVSARAEGWTLSKSQFAGLPAVKVVSSLKKDANQKMVQYYVQSGKD